MGSPSEEFGPYVVYEQIGLGGMATVHRAETKGLAGFSRQVALKRMLPGIAADERLVQSFIREARLASHLRHANVAQTYDLGKVGDTYFIAMELVPGRNLREILMQCATTAGHMPLALAMNIVNQLADALDYAHDLCDESGRPLGIIHRDVSPANVIVSEGGVVKLIDFGIAKASKASGMQTMSGTLKGKFGYMAPECLHGQVDARSDLFALGVIAHELLTNRPLFQGRDDMDTLNRVREMPIVPPSQLHPKVPPELDAIVMTALERDPDRRWQRASALREALTAETKGLGLVARDAEVIAWIDEAFERAPVEQSEPSIVITAGATEVGHGTAADAAPLGRGSPPPAAEWESPSSLPTHYDRSIESWNDMETREVKQMPVMERRLTSAHVVPRKDRGSSPPQSQTARGSSPRHPAGSPAIARGSSPRHDAAPRPATSGRDSSPRHDATPRPATSARDSSPRHDAAPQPTSSARDSSPRHPTSTTPTSPVRTVPERRADVVPTRDSALTLQTPLARERLPTLNRPPTPDPEPTRDSAPTIESSLARERATTHEDRHGKRLRTLAAADERATRSGVPRLPLVAEPSQAAIAVRASDLQAEHAIEAALDELDDDATHARTVAPREMHEEAPSGAVEKLLLPILVLIAAGGAAAVVYFALPHLT